MNFIQRISEFKVHEDVDLVIHEIIHSFTSHETTSLAHLRSHKTKRRIARLTQAKCRSLRFARMPGFMQEKDRTLLDRLIVWYRREQSRQRRSAGCFNGLTPNRRERHTSRQSPPESVWACLRILCASQERYKYSSRSAPELSYVQRATKRSRPWLSSSPP